MRQAENKVFIEGILSEIDIVERTYTKDGVQNNALAGQIKVRVEQKINGVDKILEIPVHVFVNEMTKKGTKNPAYESIDTVRREFISIASGAGVEGADRIRISGASIQMNEYWADENRLSSYPRINASFVQRVKRDEFTPKAQFSTELVVSKMVNEVDKDGVETGRLKVEGILPQYGGRVDVVPFIAENPNVVDAISQYWQPKDTVKVSGKLNFSSTVEIYTEEQGFGEPIEKKRTINVSELVITGGSQTPLEGDFAFNEEEIKNALAERKARLENRKAKELARSSSRTAPAQSGFASDIGF